MKIGISTRGLDKGSYAISTIILYLTRKLIELGSPNHQFYLYFNDPAHEGSFPEDVSKFTFKSSNRFIWDQFWLPWIMNRHNLDFSLFMKGTMPLLLNSKGAVIFHDLGYFDSELQPYRKFETQYMKKMMRLASSKAAVLFADSKHTATEMERILNPNPQKIHVCHQDCSPIFQPAVEQAYLRHIKKKYSLPDKFIFSPVSLSPRKNMTRTIEAFSKIKHSIPHHLIITGGKSWGENHLLRSLLNDDFNKIRLLGQVSEEDLPGLYSLADFLVYPSLLEGFGLPILESFRCGCPVLTSNSTSIPEVAADAAILIDPYNVSELADGILKLAGSTSLKQDLISKGFTQSQNFSWEKTAQIILNALEENHQD